MQQIYPSLKIVNIASVWNLHHPVKIEGKSGKKKKFNADIIRDGKKRLLVFGSGKIIATGFKTIRDAGTFINNIYPEAIFEKISGSCAVIKFDKIIKASEIFKSDLKVSYEPELFPAIMWKENGTAFNYFHKGSLVITGAKSYSQLNKSLDLFCKRFCFEKEKALENTTV
ncbi:uncharacterized protein LOC128397438 [Panonychus citri]|uniref:uncharacterized protein LOC128397048 n=1 Tax=Panonychus citri TaxID=50023 RepID=UPI002307B1A9|nr:uncharacterized protein LOC128397048 [Panonychus citri]XP_053214140.1 uncharacterized protein LOC128397438 [Panonychus citri]